GGPWLDERFLRRQIIRLDLPFDPEVRLESFGRLRFDLYLDLDHSLLFDRRLDLDRCLRIDGGSGFRQVARGEPFDLGEAVLERGISPAATNQLAVNVGRPLEESLASIQL